jgi:ABC-2 type transport system permease protein
VKFATIAVKVFRERVRDRGSLALLILFPAVFMLVFGFAFGGAGGGGNTPYDIVVLNDDSGANMDHHGLGYVNFGQNLSQILEDLTYENSTVPLFTLHNATRQEALDLLKERDVACIVTIPGDFSEAMEALANSTVRTLITSLIGEGTIPSAEFVEGTLPVEENVTATVIIEGDMGFMSFGTAQSMIRGILSQYTETVQAEAARQALEAVPGGITTGPVSGHLDVQVNSVSGTREFTGFDYQAPGIIIFGLLMGAVTAATALSREVESQTLARLKISLMNSFDLLFGSLLPWSLFAMLQLLILFGVALAMGFHWVGGVSSLLIAIFVGCIAGVACVSLGLLVAAFAKSEEHASNLGTLVAVPLSFLVGAFFALPDQAEVVTAFLPWRQAFTALLQLLTYDATLAEVMPNIAIMIVETAVLFVVGVVAFSKMRMKAE